MPTIWMLALCQGAVAAEPAFDGAKETIEEAEKPTNALSAELGFTFTNGNAWAINVAAALKYKHHWGQNEFAFGAGTNLSLNKADVEGDGTANNNADEPFAFTQQRVESGLRYDRFFGTSDSLYLSAGFERAPFGGLNWRFNQQVGYRRVLAKTDKTQLDLETGLAYNEENYVTIADGNADGIADDPLNDAVLDAHYLALRLFLGLTHAFNDVVSIGNDLEMYEPLVAFRAAEPDSVTNFADFRLINTFSLTTKISDMFSLKVSDRLAFDNQTPNDAIYSKLDNTLQLTLVATIL